MFVRRALTHQEEDAKPSLRKRRLTATGRPSSYLPEYAEQAANLVLAFGKTQDQLGEMYGVSGETIREWVKRYPAFAASVRITKEQSDAAVVKSLFLRATGYSHPAVKIVYDKEEQEFRRTSYIEHYPPDTGAICFWLKNRQPDLWREVISYAAAGTPDDSFAGISDDKLADIVMRGVARAADAALKRRDSKVVDVKPEKAERRIPSRELSVQHEEST